MNMTIEQIKAAYPNVAKLESQAGRELLAAVVGQMNALAAENAGLKLKAKELIGEASLVYSKYNDTQMPDRDLEDMQTLQEMHDMCESGSGGAFLVEVRASAIEHAASERWGSGYVFDELNEFAAQLRQGEAL